MNFAERLGDIQKRMNAACVRSGRAPTSVRLMAVSKKQPVSAIEELYRAGQRDFGESYVQELAYKRQRLSHLRDLHWHLIGHLQTNKVKQALVEADAFHALDSEKLIREVAKRSGTSGRSGPWPVFLEVNVDRAPTKSGVAPEELGELVAAVLREPSLRLEGLMSIPEPCDPVEKMRAPFKALASLAREIQAQRPGMSLGLSMGMSDDFEVAIEEGATWVRVGTRLFGERSKQG